MSSTFDRVPEPVAQVADVISGFAGGWYLCGGWAVDAWLGRQTREHQDIDTTVLEDDLDALFEHFSHIEGWQLIAHDEVEPDATEQWDGRRLVLPAHVHVRLEDRVNLDVQVGMRDGADYLLSRDPRIAIELRRCGGTSGWGVPTLCLEALLFYKARGLRPQDEADFRAALPRLTEEQRGWLRDAIVTLQPDHPWLAELAT